MEALGIDAKQLVAQIVNFVLFLFIFKRFIAKPFFNYLHEAEKKEKDKEKILNDLKKQEEKVKEREKDILNTARDQATALINDAKKTALSQREEMIKKATGEAAEIKEKAKKQLDEERKNLYIEVKEKISETSAAIAKAALKDYLNEERQRELVKKIFENVDKKALYEN